jgi:hypothetical protein
VTITSPAGATTAPAAGPIITEPGVYDMTAAEYHADPVPQGSLSSSGARRLLAPKGCPALFRHEQDHGRPPKRQFDIGHAAHKLVLGTGPELRLLKHDNLNTKVARADRDAAYADGAVPLLRADWDAVHAMAAAIRQHPMASRLFDPANGKGEQALFWWDTEAQVIRRAMLDWLRERRGTERLIVSDYKTTTDASPEAIAKAVDTYGYHAQGDWYLDAVKALGLHGGIEPAFVLVFQEKQPPYLVTVVELDAMALRIGRARNRRSLEIYRECVDSGRWPGYSDGIELIALPAWAEIRDTQEYL